MEYSNHFEFEDVVQANPTFKFFLREAKLDYDKLEHQTNIMCSVLVLAIDEYLRIKYR